MNIEIANRLQQLRKEKGYSQEELAEKLGISRQAVSKWERAESSPDTDNLICLAKLYNISLDELLKTEDDVETIVEEQKKDEVKQDTSKGKKKSFVNLGKDGIHIVDDKEEVHISLKGIKVNVKDGDDEISVGDGVGVNVNVNKEEKPRNAFVHGLKSMIPLLAVISYIVMGSFFNLWHPGWLVFLGIPVLESLIEAIYHKDIHKFAFPVLVVVVYLYLGFIYTLWHPMWVLFLLIPVYYSVLPKGKNYINVSTNDNDEDDDD